MKTVDERLKELEARLQERTASMIGYPLNLEMHYEELNRFRTFQINNLGDPFDYLNYQVNSKDIEREVLAFFAEVFEVPADSAWGYVTTGGTEGNMCGLFLARETYPEAVLLASDQTHYSIAKIARILRIPFREVGSLENGEIDYAEFESMIQTIEQPIIVNVNYGTTVKGAIDDVQRIREILIRNNMTFYIHCDAALFGMLLAFVDGAPDLSLADIGDGINSVAISGHKFIGTPDPCGVILTYKHFVEKVKRKIEYVDTWDTTILGSRSGHLPLVLWYAIQKRGKEGFAAEARQCLEGAAYLKARLDAIGYESFLNPYSNTVVLKKPSQEIVKKWQLACQGHWSHVIVMQQVTKEKLDALVAELERESR